MKAGARFIYFTISIYLKGLSMLKSVRQWVDTETCVSVPSSWSLLQAQRWSKTQIQEFLLYSLERTDCFCKEAWWTEHHALSRIWQLCVMYTRQGSVYEIQQELSGLDAKGLDGGSGCARKEQVSKKEELTRLGNRLHIQGEAGGSPGWLEGSEEAWLIECWYQE